MVHRDEGTFFVAVVNCDKGIFLCHRGSPQQMNFLSLQWHTVAYEFPTILKRPKIYIYLPKMGVLPQIVGGKNPEKYV